MYNQTRSFNLGLAMEVGVEAALIYDDLAYAQQSFGDGYFFRSYEQLLKRLPVMSERTARTAIRKLEAQGWITTKVKKDQGGITKCHYQICRSLSAKIAEPIESAKIAEPIYKTTKEETKPDSVSLVDKNNPATDLLARVIAIVNPKEKATTERLRMLNGRLKDYTADEILGSARALSKSDWHRENKQMSVDNLLAPSKFGRWYAQRTDTVADTPPEVTIENQDDMVRKRMGGDNGAQ